MSKYESVFILDTLKVDDDGRSFGAEIEKLVTSLGGDMVESVHMGRKQFAREIKRRKGGIYWNFVFNLGPDAVKKVRDKFRLDERVLRMMVIIYDRPEGEPKTKPAAEE